MNKGSTNQNVLLTKEKDSVVESHNTHSPHWPGQSTTRDLPPLSSRGAIHLSRGKALDGIVHAPCDQQHLNFVKGVFYGRTRITTLLSQGLALLVLTLG